MSPDPHSHVLPPMTQDCHIRLDLSPPTRPARARTDGLVLQGSGAARGERGHHFDLLLTDPGPSRADSSGIPALPFKPGVGHWLQDLPRSPPTPTGFRSSPRPGLWGSWRGAPKLSCSLESLGGAFKIPGNQITFQVN